MNMTEYQRFKMIRSQTLAVIVQITHDPRPSYTLDGQSVPWADYLNGLRDTVVWCDLKMIEGT